MLWKGLWKAMPGQESQAASWSLEWIPADSPQENGDLSHTAAKELNFANYLSEL